MEIKQGKMVYPTRKVTRENIDRILHDIRRGSPKKHAAEANLISEAHFYNLVNQGISDINHEVYDSLPAYLVESLRKIEQLEIIDCKSDIRMCPKGHNGAQWILEKVYWREFSGDAKLMELAAEMEQLKIDMLDARNQKPKGDV